MIFADRFGTDANGLQNAIDAGISRKETVFIRRGTYTINVPLVIDTESADWFELTGDFPTITASVSMARMIQVPNLSKRLRISNLHLNGNSNATVGLELNSVNSPNAVVENIIVEACATGYDLISCQSMTLQYCDANLCTVRGYHVNDCNNTLITRCRSLGNETIDDQVGMVIDSTSNPGAVAITHCSFEKSGGAFPDTGDGVRILATTAGTKKAVFLHRVWVEQSGRHAVFVQRDNVVIKNCELRIQGSTANRSVQLDDPAAPAGITGCTVTDNFVHATQGVLDSSGGGTHIIRDNIDH